MASHRNIHQPSAGYAQGGGVTDSLATTIGNSKDLIPASRVAAIALVSDPRRDPATTQLGIPVSPGKASPGRVRKPSVNFTDRVRTICAEGDSYSSTHP